VSLTGVADYALVVVRGRSDDGTTPWYGDIALFLVPIVGMILRNTYVMPLNREAAGSAAIRETVRRMEEGFLVGVFPEGTRSRGKVLRARSGVGRLALEVPEAHLTLVAIEGTTELTGFPRRPRIRIRFFDPAGGQPRPDEDPGALSARLLSEIRELVPPSLSARKRAKLSGVSED